MLVGDGLGTDGIEANYDNGVLTVRIPVAEQAKPRKVGVGSSSSAGQTDRNHHHQLTHTSRRPRPVSRPGPPSTTSKEVRLVPDAWSDKRERQYEHIKDGLVDRGETEDTAEKIAARTVNKERARAGEARQASRTSTEDISSGRRGGLRSHHGPGGRTRDQLYNEARQKGIPGRSKMNKAELQRAVDR